MLKILQVPHHFSGQNANSFAGSIKPSETWPCSNFASCQSLPHPSKKEKKNHSRQITECFLHTRHRSKSSALQSYHPYVTAQRTKVSRVQEMCPGPPVSRTLGLNPGTLTPTQELSALCSGQYTIEQTERAASQMRPPRSVPFLCCTPPNTLPGSPAPWKPAHCRGERGLCVYPTAWHTCGLSQRLLTSESVRPGLTSPGRAVLIRDHLLGKNKLT